LQISVFGAGYVGLVTAACLADAGHDVVCCDTDSTRVSALQHGRSPIFEPQLPELIQRNLSAGRLRFTVCHVEAVEHGSLVFIAVGTPLAAGGQADLRQVLQVATSIGSVMSDYKVIVDKSTVPVGTAEQVRRIVAAQLQARSLATRFAVVANPEFLREGSAVDDFVNPDRVVLGCDGAEELHWMRQLYAAFVHKPEQLVTMDVRSAELTKYAANGMLALRISFVNELARLAEALGADIEQVRRGIGTDPRIGRHYLQAGCGWGGSCLPKDVSALAASAALHDVPMPLLQAVRESNRQQRGLLLERVVARFGPALHGHRFAVWGLAFKAGTDDLREAPSKDLIDGLLARGGVVHACDPAAAERARQAWLPRPGLHIEQDAMTAAEGASALLVVTEWPQFRQADLKALHRCMKTPILFDGRNLYDPQHVQRLGFEYSGIGRIPFRGATGATFRVPKTPAETPSDPRRRAWAG
jgi:UDPglucose 6-dehydrogenase